MNILQINTVYNQGSTGKIAYQIQQIAKSYGNQCIVAYRYAESDALNNTYCISTWLDCHIHNRFAKMTGWQGRLSYVRTQKFIKYLDKYKLDLIHLHNIHGSFINQKLLFSYIKNNNTPIVWTLHDCWSFTGQCPYFTMVKCDKWKTGCHHCPQYREYPAAYVDRTKTMWKLKKKWFTGIQNMTIITPSQWLADLVKQSYLKDYPVQVINNGIDLNIFKPTLNDFRVKYGLGNKFIVLGIAFGWGKRKGLDVFIELSKRLDSNKYKIVLVGTDDKTDKLLPNNIISIHRTQNQTELAEIYTAADVFANPTREEVFGLVNAEALACGTPVLTFRTGGSPEVIDDKSGFVVDCDDIDAMEREIVRICENKPYSKEACLERAKSFDMNDKYEEYINLYEKIRNSNI